MADRAPDGGDPPPPRLVLASASPRRAELLARLGLVPEVRPANVDESTVDGESPTRMVTRLAAAKASAGAAAGEGDEIVLGADTVVVLAGSVLGKPRDEAQATEMLRSLSGRTHTVVTGIAVVRDGELQQDHVTTRVQVRTLEDPEIAWYVATGEPADKAGAYGLQGAAAAFVERIDGSDTNVIGLPLPATIRLLRASGLEVLGR